MSLPVSIKEVPFIKLLIPFVAGIACQYWLQIFSYSWINYFFVLLSLSLVVIGYFLSSKWRFRWLFGLFLFQFLFLAGSLLTIKKPTDEKLLETNEKQAIIFLLDNPQQRAKTIRVQVDVRFLYENNSWYRVDEKMLIYFDLKDSLAVKLRYGSILATKIKPSPILPSNNPNQFDFKKYLSDRGISFTSYIKPSKWIVIGEEGFWLRKFALHLRDKLIMLFKTSGLSGDELAVASALTLGYQDLLDDELRQVYSSSGAMHILSVSGLHVGILYILLSFLLKFLNKKTSTRIIKAIILLAFLWFFALLTGIPPCVQRSALMFSFVVVGDCFIRKSNIYNTIAASAFILLAVNPLTLVDIGFQLSYLAVISIVFFYPLIYKLAYIKNRALDMVWSLIAVSIAAQFGTFALCIFYFNQFPNYFLLSNLLAIPLSTIALYLSVLLIIVSPFGVIAGFIGKVFSITIGLLNSSLAFVESLPFSVSEGLHITSLQLLLIVLILLGFSIFYLSKRYSALLGSLLCLAIFLIINLHTTIQNNSKSELVVFDIQNKSLLSLRVGKELLFLDFDTSHVNHSEKRSNRDKFNKSYGFNTKGYISSFGANNHFDVYNPYLKDESKSNSSFFDYIDRQGVIFLNFKNNTFAIPYEESFNSYKSSKTLKVDYLYIKNGITVNALNLFNPKFVIIDHSVSKKNATAISLSCSKNKIPTFLVSSNGAFIL